MPSPQSSRTTIWHGSREEASDLESSLANNCACEFDTHDEHVSTCPAHRMLKDQRTLDRLLFARYMAERLSAQEFGLADPATSLTD